MQPPVNPILVSVGPFAIHWYGLLIVTGIMLGAISATHLAKKTGHDPEYIWDMLLYVVLAAVIGARAYHVFSSPEGGLIGWEYYKQNPLQALYIWEGGLGIFGAIIGGALSLLIYTKIRHLDPLTWLDFAVPGMALGQSIGRWGNFINRELYGPPTTLPWGLIIPPQNRIMPYIDLTQYPLDTRFHPTFLYESLAALVLFLVLFQLGTKSYQRLKKGDLLIGYLVGYSVIRFFTEILRPDAWEMGALAAAQVFSLVFIVLGVGFFVIRHQVLPKKSAPSQEPLEAEESTEAPPTGPEATAEEHSEETDV